MRKKEINMFENNKKNYVYDDEVEKVYGKILQTWISVPKKW